MVRAMRPTACSQLPSWRWSWAPLRQSQPEMAASGVINRKHTMSQNSVLFSLRGPVSCNHCEIITKKNMWKRKRVTDSDRFNMKSLTNRRQMRCKNILFHRVVLFVLLHLHLWNTFRDVELGLKTQGYDTGLGTLNWCIRSVTMSLQNMYTNFIPVDLCTLNRCIISLYSPQLQSLYKSRISTRTVGCTFISSGLMPFCIKRQSFTNALRDILKFSFRCASEFFQHWSLPPSERACSKQVCSRQVYVTTYVCMYILQKKSHNWLKPSKTRVFQLSHYWSACKQVRSDYYNYPIFMVT